MGFCDLPFCFRVGGQQAHGVTSRVATIHIHIDVLETLRIVYDFQQVWVQLDVPISCCL
ncbi:hypothetical protein NPIL_443581, partial [Nephila pilipes]